MSRVRDLLQKWRISTTGEANIVRDCADELEAAIVEDEAQQFEPVTEQMVRQAYDCWSGFGPGTYAGHLAKVINNQLKQRVYRQHEQS